MSRRRAARLGEPDADGRTPVFLSGKLIGHVEMVGLCWYARPVRAYSMAETVHQTEADAVARLLDFAAWESDR